MSRLLMIKLMVDLNACIRQEAANATVLEERDEVVRLLEAEKVRWHSTRPR